MNPPPDRRSKMALLWITVLMAVTSVAAVVAILAWARAPFVRLEAVFESHGAELFLAGRTFGIDTVRLVDEELLALSEEDLVAPDWPPPGASRNPGVGWSRVAIDSYVMSPAVSGGDHVWHFQIENSGRTNRYAIRLRAVDVLERTWKVEHDHQTTHSSWRTSSTHTFEFHSP